MCRAHWLLHLVELPIGKVNTLVKSHPGYKILGHQGGGSTVRSWAGWLLGLTPSGYPGGGSAGRYWASWLLGLIPLGYPDGGLAWRYWVGWLLGLIPLGFLGWAGWPRVPSLGPWYLQWPVAGAQIQIPPQVIINETGRKLFNHKNIIVAVQV